MKKIIIWTLAFLIGLTVIAFVATSIYVKNLKPTLEDTLTKTLGLKTTIDGQVALKVFPGISIVISDLKIISRETYLFRVEQLEIAIDYMKLFSREININALHFKAPQVYLVRDLDGVFNYHSPQAGFSSGGIQVSQQIALADLTIENGRVLYFDRPRGDSLMVKGINLQTENLSFQGSFDNIDINKLSYSGTIDINSFHLNMLSVDSLQLKVDSRGGKISIQPKDKTYFSGESSGKAIIDFTQKPVFIHIQHQLTGLDIGAFQEAINTDELLYGNLNTSLDISFHSFDWGKAIETMKGEIKVSGSNLLMQSINLDKALNNYNSTRHFSVDALASVFVAGPYGAVFTKAITYANAFSTNVTEMTEVDEFVSNWSIDKGIASAKDVAFSTAKYRMALTGKLDLTNNTYNNMMIALINKEGCAVLSEELNGAFIIPEKESFSTLERIRGSIDDLWMKLAKPSRITCDPVYTGSVSHPSGN